jgi:hypothetical protein
MNKFFLSAGLMAIGATSFQAYAEQPTDIIPAKFWNVSGTLRGFYDDNYNVGANKKGSAGFEVSPSVSVNVPLQQTDFGMRYTYGAYYYQQRQDLNLDPFDQTHQLDFWLDHSFNERWKANVNDSFVVGQEPDLLQNNPTTGEASQIRVNGNNIANHGNFKLDTDWTRLFSTSLYYNNSLYDYEQDGATVADLFPTTEGGTGIGASRAGILNRVEQKVGMDFQWHLQPETTAFVGYALGLDNYTAGEPIAFYQINPKQYYIYNSDYRDNYSHYGYVGVSHQFTPNLTATVRGGASYTDNYNNIFTSNNSVSPYAEVSASYTYLPGSYVQIGFTHDINSTDQVTPNPTTGSMTDYAESSVGYLSVNHRITKKLMGSIIGRCQYSTYEGGLANNETSTDYGLGFNLHYDINQHFGLDAGYNYDHLTSDQNVSDGSYERNRVYIGLMASY